MKRILLVCPDTGVSDELTLFLEHSGFRVAGVAESTQVMSEMDRCSPDIMVIRENGRRLNDDELCIRIRESSDVPILVLGQTEGQLAAVEMLEVGADAYLAYPWDSRELLARIRSLLRRRRGHVRHDCDPSAVRQRNMWRECR